MSKKENLCEQLNNRLTIHEQKFELFLKDFQDVQKYVSSRQDWEQWGLRIILGALIVSILSLLGLQK